MKEIKVETDLIKLDSFMKWAAIVSSGAEAKMYIQNGEVKYNGEIEVRRGKKIFTGDVIEFQGEEYKRI